MYSMWHCGQGLYKVFLTDLLFPCSDTHCSEFRDLYYKFCLAWIPNGRYWCQMWCYHVVMMIFCLDVMPCSAVEVCWHCRGLVTSMVRVGDGDMQLHWNVGMLLLHYMASFHRRQLTSVDMQDGCQNVLGTASHPGWGNTTCMAVMCMYCTVLFWHVRVKMSYHSLWLSSFQARQFAGTVSGL